MASGSEETDQIFERWLPDYSQRAQSVERELATLFQEAFDRESPGALLEKWR